jgi:hypothetical protein
LLLTSWISLSMTAASLILTFPIFSCTAALVCLRTSDHAWPEPYPPVLVDLALL